MGVGGVGADGDVGAVLGDEAFARDGLLEELDDGVLVGAAVRGRGCRSRASLRRGWRRGLRWAA